MINMFKLKRENNLKNENMVPKLDKIEYQNHSRLKLDRCLYVCSFRKHCSSSMYCCSHRLYCEWFFNNCHICIFTNVFVVWKPLGRRILLTRLNFYYHYGISFILTISSTII